MENLTIAHLNLPGPQGPVNVIIVFLNQTFDQKTPQQQQEIQAALQLCANSADLAGNVVPVWQDSSGRMKFRAPQNQRAFFSSASYEQLYSQANKTLTCGD
jgi:hypothetical protein